LLPGDHTEGWHRGTTLFPRVYTEEGGQLGIPHDDGSSAGWVKYI